MQNSPRLQVFSKNNIHSHVLFCFACSAFQKLCAGTPSGRSTLCDVTEGTDVSPRLVTTLQTLKASVIMGFGKNHRAKYADVWRGFSITSDVKLLHVVPMDINHHHLKADSESVFFFFSSRTLEVSYFLWLNGKNEARN